MKMTPKKRTILNLKIQTTKSHNITNIIYITYILGEAFFKFFLKNIYITNITNITYIQEEVSFRIFLKYSHYQDYLHYIHSGVGWF